MKKTKREEFRKMTMFFMGILILLSLTFAFYYAWVNYFNVGIIWAFDTKGNYLIFVLYFMLQYLFSRIYGALKIDQYKVGNVVYSQGLATAIVDVVMYVVMSLISRVLVSIPTLLVLFVVQMGIIVIWAYICIYVYKKLYPPRDLVVVYSYHSATNLVRKMAVRDDQFHICEAISLDKGFDYIKERIEEYDGVIICDIPGSVRNDILKYCYSKGKLTYVTPKLSDIILSGAEEIHLFDTPLLLCRNTGITFEQRFIKRLIDIVVSLLGLIVASPFMLITAIAIKAYDGGSVFFKQDRVTKDGKVFQIIKFRSMRENADADFGGKAHSATKDDDRITPVGKIIRACRMDEFPQIFNILKGDMSVVGPRPECVENVEKYTEDIPEFKYRLKVKAGLTGYAQIYGKYNTTAYDKLKLDLYYIENYAISDDLRLILQTVKVLFMKESTEAFEEETAITEDGVTVTEETASGKAQS